MTQQPSLINEPEKPDEFPMRHVVIYTKGHYRTTTFKKDLITILGRIFPKHKIETTAAIIKFLFDLTWATIMEFSAADSRNARLQTTDDGEIIEPERPPVFYDWKTLYKEQWMLLANMKGIWNPSWNKYPAFFQLTEEEQAQIKAMFQEEFEERILQAFTSPIGGWMPNLDLGDPSPKILPLMSPERKEK